MSWFGRIMLVVCAIGLVGACVRNLELSDQNRKLKEKIPGNSEAT